MPWGNRGGAVWLRTRSRLVRWLVLSLRGDKRSRYGLRAGLIGVDYRNELSAVTFALALDHVHVDVDDRFWRPENRQRVRQHADKALRHYHKPCGDDGVCPAWTGNSLRRMTWTWLGSQINLTHAITVAQSDDRLCAPHVITLFLSRNAQLHDSQAVEGRLGNVTEADVRQCRTTVELPQWQGGIASLSQHVPLPRSHASVATSVDVTPPLVWLQTRWLGDDPRRHHAAFPPILHYAGQSPINSKGQIMRHWISLALPSALSFTTRSLLSSAAPSVSHTDKEPKCELQPHLRAYLSAIPVELCSRSQLQRGRFSEVCPAALLTFDP